jgi:hypothetical protein
VLPHIDLRTRSFPAARELGLIAPCDADELASFRLDTAALEREIR